MATLGILRLTPKQRGILTKLAQAFPTGHVYLVGGAVRDLLLKRPVKDLDVVIAGITPSSIRRKLLALGKVYEIGARFGIFQLTPQGEVFHVDIALPRAEKGMGTGGYRDFSFRPDPTLAIEEDLSRRDFTSNAMALSWRDAVLIDPFHGRQDIARRILRAVGTPEKRFGEDFSRLLRMLRFAAALDFSIHPKTAAAARRLMPHLNDRRDDRFVVPREVIAEQLIRTFTQNPLRAFELLKSFGVFRVIVPEMRDTKARSSHVHRMFARLMSTHFERVFSGETPSALTLFAVLFYDIGQKTNATTVARIARRLRLASYDGLVPTEGLLWLCRHFSLVQLKNPERVPDEILGRLFSHEWGTHLLQLLWADASSETTKRHTYQTIRRRLRKIFPSGKFEMPRPFLSGNDIMKLFGISEGEQVGQCLHALIDAQLRGAVQNKVEAKIFMKGLLDTHDAA